MPMRPSNSSTSSPSPPVSAASNSFSHLPTTSARPTPPSLISPKAPYELPPPRPRPPPQGPPPGVALPRLHQRDALLCSSCCRGLRPRLRSHQLPHPDPPDLGRHPLGCSPLCLHHCPQPVMGPRTTQSGSGSP